MVYILAVLKWQRKLIVKISYIQAKVLVLCFIFSRIR